MAGGALFRTVDRGFKFDGVDLVMTNQAIVVLDPLQSKGHERARDQE
jgi:hypothetical protein